MKKNFFLISIAGLLLMGACRTTKVSSWDDFKSRYAGAGTSIRVNGPLFKLGMNIASISADDPEAELLLHQLRKFKGVEVHIIPLRKTELSHEDINNLDHLLIKDAYASMVNVRNGSDHIRIWAKGEKDEFKNPLILINNAEDLIMVELRGTLTSDDIGALASAGSRLYK